MLRLWFVLCLVAGIGSAQNGTLTVTSAASASAGISGGGLATATGAGLSVQTAAAESSPWPTTLGGVTVQVQDSGSVTRPAGILYVSPTQVNFQIPAGTALGAAAITIDNGSTRLNTIVQVQPAAPALFSVNGDGVAAATAVRISLSGGGQFAIPVFQCGDTAASCQPVALDPGLDTPVYLSFYGTGIRNRADLESVRVKIGAVDVIPTYAGPQDQFAGLDQVNVPLVLSLRGAGTVNVTVAVNGVTSNPVKISVQ